MATHTSVVMKGFLLVFDLDGTLVDSVPDLRAALNEMLRERGRRPLSPPQVKRMVGDGVPALVARALAASGGDASEAASALPRFLRDLRGECGAAHAGPTPGCRKPRRAAQSRLPNRDLHQQAAAGDDRGIGGPRPPAAVRRDRRRRPFFGQKARSRPSVGADCRARRRAGRRAR